MEDVSDAPPTCNLDCAQLCAFRSFAICTSQVLMTPGARVVFCSSLGAPILHCLVALHFVFLKLSDAFSAIQLVAQCRSDTSTHYEVVARYKELTGASVRYVTRAKELDWMYDVPAAHYICADGTSAALFEFSPVPGRDVLTLHYMSDPPAHPPLPPRLPSISTTLALDHDREGVPTSVVGSQNEVQLVAGNSLVAVSSNCPENSLVEVVLVGGSKQGDVVDAESCVAPVLVGGMPKRRRDSDQNDDDRTPLASSTARGSGEAQESRGADKRERRVHIRPGHVESLDWPRWVRPVPVADDFHIEVQIQSQPAVRIRVPNTSRAMLEECIAEHLGTLHRWLAFTWVGSQVAVEWAALSPGRRPALAVRSELQRAVARFLSRTTSQRGRRALLRVRTLAFGLRSTRRAGITMVTRTNPGFVQLINRLAAQALPGATFQAFAIVIHGSVPLHTDVMNKPSSLIHLLSWQAGSCWIEVCTGATKAFTTRRDHPDRDTKGVNIDLRRAGVSFYAAKCHAISVPGDALTSTIVFYTTRRAPDVRDTRRLQRLGFPLPEQFRPRVAPDPQVGVVDDEQAGEHQTADMVVEATECGAHESEEERDTAFHF
eukprot:4705908-Amphidinium_carterae.1